MVHSLTIDRPCIIEAPLTARRRPGPKYSGQNVLGRMTPATVMLVPRPNPAPYRHRPWNVQSTSERKLLRTFIVTRI